MDNLTHSLAGMLLAEAVLQRASRREFVPRRTWVYVASIVANNLPDADFVLTPLTEGKLGYLLHHRGHTHTVVIALGLALLQTALCALWLRRSAPEQWRFQAKLVAVVSTLGVLVHLLLDFGNNYGVHPFWPLDSRWFYGDAVFIIEPWWWSLAGAALFRLVQTRAARLTQLAIWALGTLLPWALPLPFEVGAYCSVLGLAALGVGLVPFAAGKRLVVFGSLLVLLYGGQLGLRALAENQVRAELAEEPALTVLDLIRTPLPGAPWCWDVLVVGLDASGPQRDYVVRAGRATALPGVDTERCPVMRSESTAPLAPVTKAAASKRVRWDGEYRVGVEALGRFTDSCWVQAFLRYARAPYVLGERRIVGDLRFDRTPELEFTELIVPGAHVDCPQRVPRWEPPRADLLDDLKVR